MAEQDNELVTTGEALPAELTEEQKEKIKQALKVESEALLVEWSKTQDPQKNKDLTYLSVRKDTFSMEKSTKRY